MDLCTSFPRIIGLYWGWLSLAVVLVSLYLHVRFCIYLSISRPLQIQLLISRYWLQFKCQKTEFCEVGAKCLVPFQVLKYWLLNSVLAGATRGATATGATTTRTRGVWADEEPLFSRRRRPCRVRDNPRSLTVCWLDCLMLHCWSVLLFSLTICCKSLSIMWRWYSFVLAYCLFVLKLVFFLRLRKLCC